MPGRTIRDLFLSKFARFLRSTRVFLKVHAFFAKFALSAMMFRPFFTKSVRFLQKPAVFDECRRVRREFHKNPFHKNRALTKVIRGKMKFAVEIATLSGSVEGFCLNNRKKKIQPSKKAIRTVETAPFTNCGLQISKAI